MTKLYTVNQKVFSVFVYAFFLLASTIAYSADTNDQDCSSKKNPFEQLSCYATMAKATNNLNACDQAAHAGVRYQCYAIFAEFSDSPAICNKIPATTNEHRSLIDICISDVAKKVHDASLCEGIITKGLRDSCYLKLANEMSDRTLCAKIQDAGLKSICSKKSAINE